MNRNPTPTFTIRGLRRPNRTGSAIPDMDAVFARQVADSIARIANKSKGVVA